MVASPVTLDLQGWGFESCLRAVSVKFSPCLLVFHWFPPQSKDMSYRVIGVSKLAIVSNRVCDYVCLCPETCCDTIQAVPRLVPRVPWNCLQPNPLPPTAPPPTSNISFSPGI